MVLSWSLHSYVLLPPFSCLVIQPFWPVSNSLDRPCLCPQDCICYNLCHKGPSTSHLANLAHPLGNLPSPHRTGLGAASWYPQTVLFISLLHETYKTYNYCLFIHLYALLRQGLCLVHSLYPQETCLTQEKYRQCFPGSLSRTQAEFTNWRERQVCI